MVLYTKLVLPGILTPEKLVELMAYNPRRRFSIPLDPGDFSVWDLNRETVIDPADFLSRGRATPFAGMRVRGKCMAVFCGGKPVYQAEG